MLINTKSNNIIRCLQCGAILISESVHDFVQCECLNETFTDGGSDYQRVGGMDFKQIGMLDAKWHFEDVKDTPKK